MPNYVLLEFLLCTFFFINMFVCNHFHLQPRMFFFLIFFILFFYFINLMLHAYSYFMLLKAIASHVMCFFLYFIVCLISLVTRTPIAILYLFINFFYWFAEMRVCPENASLALTFCLQFP